MRCCVALLLVLAVLAPAVSATVHFVDEVSGIPSIQNGLNIAADGDTVLVMPGTYDGFMNRNLDFGGDDIVLISSGGPDVTIIDAENLDRAFVFDEYENDAFVIGFTIRNGQYDWASGGGVLVMQCSPTFENCIIEDCSSPTQGGGGMHFYQSHSDITDCIFRGNSAGQMGGALTSTNSELYVTGCLFVDNTTDGVGGAVHSGSSWNTYFDCTFVGNNSWQICVSSGGESEIDASIISHGTGDGPIQWDGSGTLNTHMTVVFGNAGGDSLQGGHTNNMFVHPLYCDPWNGIYTLCDNSPCIAANNSWGIDVGAFGPGGCGDCSSPVETRTWGGIKALYRQGSH